MSTETFDVFLSFRGPDTRQEFTQNLYAALGREQIRPFLDTESLEKGDHILTALPEGIRESKLGIPIFSKKFAESKWCLKEVSLMVEFGVEIRPVFYGVYPEDLKCREGSKYAEDLKNHKKDPKLFQEVLTWKDALQTVAARPGWCSADYSSDNDLIQDIVGEIRKILHSGSPQRQHLDVPVCFGLDRPVKDVMGFLNAAHQKKIVKLGIHGMSGIGKTTLAKAVCKELFKEFEVFSFVPSVAATCEEADELVKLQTQMLKDVPPFRAEVGHVAQGKCLLEDRLKGKRVLLVLDDIQTSEQLDALGGNCSRFGAGSRVIITSQDLQILKMANVDEVYKVSSLYTQNALRLFKFHAFPESYCPDQELGTLCNHIVDACDGLPLALQIFGKILSGQKDRNVWRDMVGKLMCEPDMQKKLKVSYDALDCNEKKMFQDIACYVTRKKKELAMIFWAAVIRTPEASLRNLLRKSLVEFGPSNELLMHRCLRDLGRRIAEKDTQCSRLFDQEDVADILCQLREKASHVLYLSDKPMKPRTLKAELLKSLYNVQLLWLTDVAIEGHFAQESSMDELRWLRLRRFSSKQLPLGMSLQKLVILEVTDSQITYLWNDYETDENPTMSPEKLSVLILRGCMALECLPGTLSRAPLQILDLHNCHSLKNLPDTMGSLTSLVSLNMEGCSVSFLPQDFGNLINLQELKLSHCQNLSKLPTTFGNLTGLKKLEIHHNYKLTELPESFGGLRSLAFLDMEKCSVSYLPQHFGELLNLEELNLSYCQNLSQLPASFGKLTRLERLEIHHVSKLTELPESFGGLTTLAYLDVSYCGLSENGIPDGISKLSSLRVLHIGGNGIHRLPHGFVKLKQLEELNVDNCGELSVLSGFPSSVKMLFARKCKSLHTFSCHADERSPELMTLDFSNSCNLAHFHGLHLLAELKRVNMVGCNKIPWGTLVESLCGLRALESVYFGGPGVLSAQLNTLYNSFQGYSFNHDCLMNNPNPTAKWICGEAIGKCGYENKCMDYSMDKDKEYCAGYIACLLSLSEINPSYDASPPIDTLSYTIQRDKDFTQCLVKHQSSTMSGENFLEVRLVRTNSNFDFPWLKMGNKLRVQTMSNYENWRAYYSFLMYESQSVLENFQQERIPKMITFVH